MRQRIEDIGRLLVIIDKMIGDIEDPPCRIKDLDEYLEKKSRDEIVDLLSDAYSCVRIMKDQLYDCLEICKGDDYLNVLEP